MIAQRKKSSYDSLKMKNITKEIQDIFLSTIVYSRNPLIAYLKKDA